MNGRKSVLLIGLDPDLIDSSAPDYAATGMDAGKVIAGLQVSRESLIQQGFEVQLCLTGFGATAEATVRHQLERNDYHCVLIGAGIRVVPGNLLLFERLLNVVHAYAPQAKLCFNTKPTDSVEAVKRWI